MTREQLIKQLSQVRAKRHYIPNLSRAQIKQASKSFSDEEWDAIIVSIRNKTVGPALYQPVLAYLYGLAKDDVEAMIEDDTLTLEELMELL